MRVEGKHGISDDTRVSVNWTVGFGAGAAGASGSDATVSTMGSMARADLLADVMTRPAFLPERVLARSKTSLTCDYSASIVFALYSSDFDYPVLSGVSVGFLRDSEDLELTEQEIQSIEATIVSASLFVGPTIASTYNADQVIYTSPGISFYVDPVVDVSGKTYRVVFQTADSKTICSDEYTVPY